jgi:hypothetical protein
MDAFYAGNKFEIRAETLSADTPYSGWLSEGSCIPAGDDAIRFSTSTADAGFAFRRLGRFFTATGTMVLVAICSPIVARCRANEDSRCECMASLAELASCRSMA